MVISGSSCDGSQVKDSRPKCLMFGLWPSCHKLREGNLPSDCPCQRSIIRIKPPVGYSLCWLVVYVLKRFPNAFPLLRESLPWVSGIRCVCLRSSVRLRGCANDPSTQWLKFRGHRELLTHYQTGKLDRRHVTKENRSICTFQHIFHTHL